MVPIAKLPMALEVALENIEDVRLRAVLERAAKTGDPVDLPDLVRDAGGDPLHQLVGKPRPVGRHRVLRRHRTEHDGVPVGAAVALDADRADVGQEHDRHLPDRAVEAGGGELLAGDGVGLAEDVEALAGDLADDPDAEAGAGEGLAVHDLGG